MGEGEGEGEGEGMNGMHEMWDGMGHIASHGMATCLLGIERDSRYSCNNAFGCCQPPTFVVLRSKEHHHQYHHHCYCSCCKLLLRPTYLHNWANPPVRPPVPGTAGMEISDDGSVV